MKKRNSILEPFDTIMLHLLVLAPLVVFAAFLTLPRYMSMTFDRREFESVKSQTLGLTVDADGPSQVQIGKAQDRFTQMQFQGDTCFAIACILKNEAVYLVTEGYPSHSVQYIRFGSNPSMVWSYYDAAFMAEHITHPSPLGMDY